MNTVEINLVYPFWVKVPFLMHCYDRSKRMAYLSEWLDRIHVDDCEMQRMLDGHEEQTKKHISPEALVERGSNYAEWEARRTVAHSILKMFDWKLRDFRYELKPKSVINGGNGKKNWVAEDQKLLMPLQIINHKGGIMRGVLEIPVEKKDESISFISEAFAKDNLQEPTSEPSHDCEEDACLTAEKEEPNLRAELESMLVAHFQKGLDALPKKEEKDIFKLHGIQIDLIYYDWNLGLLEFTLKFSSDHKDQKELVSDVQQLSELLEQPFSKKHIKEDDFKKFKVKYPSIIKVEPNTERNGGYVHPMYRFLEDWLRILSRLTPDRIPGMDSSEMSPVIDRIFQGRLKHEGKQLGKTREDFRMPFTGMNILIGLDTKMIAQKSRIGVNCLFKLIGMEGDAFKMIPDEGIFQIEAGYNGNLMVFDHGENLDKEHIIKIWWIWRLAMIYYAGLLRIQSFLIARMGLQMPLENLNKDHRGLEEDSIHEEIERLETLQLAIEAVIQESLENNVGDDNLRRKLYRHILGEYRMKELIDAVRIPIPKIVSDLRADLDKRKKDNEKKRTLILNYLSSLTVFSVLFSLMGAINLIAFDWFAIDKPADPVCAEKKWSLLPFLLGFAAFLMAIGIGFQLFLGTRWKLMANIRNVIGPISSDENDSVPFWSWLKSTRLGWLFKGIEKRLKEKK